MSTPQISIVIPLYNEEKVFQQLIQRLNGVLDTLSFTCEVVLIDDGSRDTTAALIRSLCLADKRYQGLLLSRNHGHQLALSAGLSVARGSEGVMVMDGDLQDPPELIASFYEQLKEGYEVIYAIRKKRKEGLFKKFVYWSYYRIQRAVSNFDIPIDSGDFGMMSRRVLNHINSMPEKSRYLRGMRSWVGYKQTGVAYERDARAAGTSNYSFRQLFALAYNGIFNFSDFPVKLITNLGIYSIVLSIVYLAYIIVKKFIFHDVPAGFTTLIAAIILFSGVQMISIGILGEYILRIYNQVRERPLYLADEQIVEGEVKKVGVS